MSNSHLVEWLDQLLFGHSYPSPPPIELKSFILRMESENISWHHIIPQGGLTAVPYQVHGDLNSLIEYLEKQWIDKQPLFDPPKFKTRTVSRFWDQLQLLLARRLEPPPPPDPDKNDDQVLKEILDPQRQNQTIHFEYKSPKFWGEVARRFINLSRPEQASALPNIDSELSDRAIKLYVITCAARGKYFDPLSMHLVPESEHLNAVHWQTGRNMEAFMRDRPAHPLTVSVRNLLKKSLDDLLQGKKPSAIQDSCPQLDSLLHNIKIVHESIEQVPHGKAPPKLVDIFQRLLALCQQDGLWEKQVEEIEPEPVSPSLLHLTEQIRILEREKKIMWKHFAEEN